MSKRNKRVWEKSPSGTHTLKEGKTTLASIYKVSNGGEPFYIDDTSMLNSTSLDNLKRTIESRLDDNSRIRTI